MPKHNETLAMEGNACSLDLDCFVGTSKTGHPGGVLWLLYVDLESQAANFYWPLYTKVAHNSLKATCNHGPLALQRVSTAGWDSRCVGSGVRFQLAGVFRGSAHGRQLHPSWSR